MDTGNFIEKLASQFGQNASVKNVYGDPIRAGNKTIIPVARIAYGLGGGYGQGNKKNKHLKFDEFKKGLGEHDAEGAGGGGGLYARPAGVYEVTSTTTRFIPATNTRQLLIGLAGGFLIKGWFNSKRKNKKIS